MKKEPKLREYYFVEDDFMGQHGTCIETIEISLHEFKEIKETRNYRGRRGFITKDYVAALYYTQD